MLRIFIFILFLLPIYAYAQDSGLLQLLNKQPSSITDAQRQELEQRFGVTSDGNQQKSSADNGLKIPSEKDMLAKDVDLSLPNTRRETETTQTSQPNE